MLLKSQDTATGTQIGLPLDAQYQNVGLWDWNLAENLIFADEPAAALFGLEPALAKRGLPPESYLSRIHPSDRSFIEKQIETCIVSLGVCSDEYRVKGADGLYHWLYTRGRCFGDAQGQATVYSGLAVRVERSNASPLATAVPANSSDPIGDILHICLNARGMASTQNMRIVTYFLDMLILELSEGDRYASKYLN